MLHFAFSLALAAAIPEIAYPDGRTLILATRTGAVVRKIRMPVAIAAFSVAPDLSKIAFIGKSKNMYGGPLYLHDVRSRRTAPPRGAPFWPHGPESEPVDEVYMDPAFSPDGTLLAFAIHTPPKGILGDIVLAAGPLALLSLPTGKVTLLDATLHVPGTADSPAYAYRPVWSPDGKMFFVNFETGFALLTASETGIRTLDPPVEGFSNALGWIGADCIAYGFGNDGKFQGAGVYHLRTERFDHPPPESYRFLFDLTPFDSFEVSGELALIGRGAETHHFELTSKKLLHRFPRGAKFIRPNQPLPAKTPPATKAAPSAPCHPTATPPQN